jgi:3-phenylpropionate/trans-cinnamate dioxygenase ferredoxin reductase subunit
MEHWTNAGDQASALAAVLTGNAAPYEPIPYVWSDQLGSKLQVWGEVRPGDEVVYLAGDAEADEFVALTGGDGRTRGVVAFGARREAMRAQRLLRTGVAWHAGKGPVEPVA